MSTSDFRLLCASVDVTGTKNLLVQRWLIYCTEAEKYEDIEISQIFSFSAMFLYYCSLFWNAQHLCNFTWISNFKLKGKRRAVCLTTTLLCISCFLCINAIPLLHTKKYTFVQFLHGLCTYSSFHLRQTINDLLCIFQRGVFIPKLLLWKR